MAAKIPDVTSAPSLGDFLLEAQRRDVAEGDFSLESPDLLGVRVNGRVRARAAAVLAANGQLRITPASRFASFAGKDQSAGILAAIDGRGRVLLGEKGKWIGVLALRPDEALVVAPHAVLAVEDTAGFSTATVRLPMKKPVDWHALHFRGPGRLALVHTGTLHTLRVTVTEPLFVRPGALVAWSANLVALGRVGSSDDPRIAFAGDGFVMMQSGLEK